MYLFIHSIPVLESALGIVLRASPSESSTPTTADPANGRGTVSCGREVLLTWTPSFSHEGNHTSGYHHVSFGGGADSAGSITALSSRLCASSFSTSDGSGKGTLSTTTRGGNGDHSISADTLRTVGNKKDSLERDGSHNGRGDIFETSSSTKRGRNKARNYRFSSSNKSRIAESGLSSLSDSLRGETKVHTASLSYKRNEILEMVAPCVPLDSTEVIGHSSYSFTPEELWGPAEEGVAPTVSLSLWLELNSRLANGSWLLISSQKVLVACSVEHATNSSGNKSLGGSADSIYSELPLIWTPVFRLLQNVLPSANLPLK